MFIIKPKQVQGCQVQLENQDCPGLIYLNRTFIPIKEESYVQLETAISAYQRWLVKENLLCVILEESDVYSIWCLAPETAKIYSLS